MENNPNPDLDSSVKECIICMLDIRNEDKVLNQPKCDHLYHWSCLKAWLKERPHCPMCRAVIRSNMLNDLHQRGENGDNALNVNQNENVHLNPEANELAILNQYR